jgi:hypothetical protein
MTTDEKNFFATPEDLRAWFAANHDKATELLLGYYKVRSASAGSTGCAEASTPTAT